MKRQTREPESGQKLFLLVEFLAHLSVVQYLTSGTESSGRLPDHHLHLTCSPMPVSRPRRLPAGVLFTKRQIRVARTTCMKCLNPSYHIFQQSGTLSEHRRSTAVKMRWNRCRSTNFPLSIVDKPCALRSGVAGVFSFTRSLMDDCRVSENTPVRYIQLYQYPNIDTRGCILHAWVSCPIVGRNVSR